MVDLSASDAVNPEVTPMKTVFDWEAGLSTKWIPTEKARGSLSHYFGRGGYAAVTQITGD